VAAVAAAEMPAAGSPTRRLPPWQAEAATLAAITPSRRGRVGYSSGPGGSEAEEASAEDIPRVAPARRWACLIAAADVREPGSDGVGVAAAHAERGGGDVTVGWLVLYSAPEAATPCTLLAPARAGVGGEVSAVLPLTSAGAVVVDLSDHSR
jgi:hypothetical protein